MYIYIYICDKFLKLVGGFNPFEEYKSNWIISQSKGENKKNWNHHLVNLSFFSIILAPSIYVLYPENIHLRNDSYTGLERCAFNTSLAFLISWSERF